MSVYHAGGYPHRQHAAPAVPNSDELVFRRVRGILNKLTIEKFDPLVHQLVQVGITTENVLKGIIVLLFEKALDEPQFCPMYARVCERLAAEGPNFEPSQPPESNEDSPQRQRRTSTFLKLLLRKCQDEFENRSRAEKLASAAGSFANVEPGSEAHRQLMAAHAELKKARTKMLGNIRFIGELGKLKLLSEKVLHRCIMQLCENAHNPIAEDVECLCQLMKTVGQQLDHDRARAHIDQYFERLQLMRDSGVLQPRIKFMIDDVQELRENNWVQRKLQQQNGPKSIQEIRLEAMEEQLQTSGSRRERQIGLQRIRMIREQMHMHGASGAGGMGMMTGPMPTIPTYSQREHGIPSQPGMFSGMKRRDPLLPDHLMQQAQSHGGDYPQTAAMGQMPPNGEHHHGDGGYGGAHHHHQGFNGDTKSAFNNRSMQDLRDLAMLKSTSGIVLKSGGAGGRGGRGSGSPSGPPMQRQQNGPPPGNVGAPKLSTSPKKLESRAAQKKDKKPTKQQLESMSTALIEEYLNALDIEEAHNCFKDMRTPKYATNLASKAILTVLDRNEDHRASICKLLSEFVKRKVLTQEKLVGAVFETSVLPMVPDLAIDVPRVRQYLGNMIATWIAGVSNESDPVMSFEDVADVLDRSDDPQHQLLGAILEALVQRVGEDETKKLYAEAGIDVRKFLPDNARGDNDVLDFVANYSVQFLYSELKMRNDLAEELKAQISVDDTGKPAGDNDGNSNRDGVRALHKWLQQLPSSILKGEKFCFHVAYTLFEFIASHTSMREGAIGLKVDSADWKSVKANEKDLFALICPLLRALAQENTRKQMWVVYALQQFCHMAKFPKGLMLRASGHLYDNDVVEEEAFSTWREEINDEIPGKGEALIAINEYLNWMRTTADDSEEESSDDDGEL